MVNNISGIGITNRTISSRGKVSAENVQEQTQAEQTSSKSCSYENVRAYQTGLNNTLATNEAKQKYSEVSSKLEPETRVVLNKLLKSACKSELTAEFHQSLVSGSLNDEKQGGIDYLGLCTQAS